MTYIEITLSDGTVARWAIRNDHTEALIIDFIEDLVGAPDTLIT